MKFLKPILGILLILVAVGGLIYWEMVGREIVTTEVVLVAASDLEEGTIILPSMLKEAAVLKENVVRGSFSPGRAEHLEGKKLGCQVAKAQQISSIHLSEEDYDMDQGKAPLPIHADWITARSSSLRQGDMVEFYDGAGQRLLGTFEIAFVKDAGDQEVVDPINPLAEKKILERTGGTGFISHVEVIATVEEYAGLLAFLMESPENRFLIVQKGEGLDG